MDSSKNMTTSASQADMTLIMVCVSTRPRVQRETIVSSVRSVLLQGTAVQEEPVLCAGQLSVPARDDRVSDVKAKLSKTHATAC